MLPDRRCFLVGLGAIVSVPAFHQIVRANDLASVRHRVTGMIAGSLIGDALGGPLEFADEATRAGHVPDCRRWDDDRRLDADEIQRLGRSLRMLSYETVRPDAAPYGPWISRAAAGTLTDDTRLKVIWMRALRGRHGCDPDQADLAKQMIEFQPRLTNQPDERTVSLLAEGLAEYRYAARWVLGERDERFARPLDRLWAGVPNCSGQMMLTPMAALYPGDGESAYRVSFAINFVDGPSAKDICSAIIAALAVALNDPSAIEQRWRNLEATMRTVDPYRLADVPFVGRPLVHWLNLADSIVERSGGRPKVAYQLLETEGKPVYYWDAHFTLLVPWTLLKLANFDPLAAMHLALDFGHDTDSYLQVMGAMIGAVIGEGVFPTIMRQNVDRQLDFEYGERIDDWVNDLCERRNDEK